jgi:hypothetical protein
MQPVINIYHYWLQYNIIKTLVIVYITEHNMFRPQYVIIRCGDVWTVEIFTVTEKKVDYNQDIQTLTFLMWNAHSM